MRRNIQPQISGKVAADSNGYPSGLMTIASVGQSEENVPAVVFFDKPDSLAQL